MLWRFGERHNLLLYEAVLFCSIFINLIPRVDAAGATWGLMHQSAQFASLTMAILGALRPRSAGERHLEQVQNIQKLNRILMEILQVRSDAASLANMGRIDWTNGQFRALSKMEEKAVEKLTAMPQEQLLNEINILKTNLDRSMKEMAATSDAVVSEMFLRAASVICGGTFVALLLLSCSTRLCISRKPKTRSAQRAETLVDGTTARELDGLRLTEEDEKILLQLDPAYAATVAYYLNEENVLSSSIGSSYSSETQEDVQLYNATSTFGQAGTNALGALATSGKAGLSAAIAVSKPFTIAASASVLTLGFLYQSDTIYSLIQTFYTCLAYPYLIGNVILPTLGFVMIGVILVNGAYVFWQSFMNRLLWVPIRIIMTFSFVALVTFGPLLGQAGAGFAAAALQFTTQGMTTSLFPVAMFLQPLANFVEQLYLFAIEGSCAILKYVTGGIGRAIASPILVNATDATANIPLNLVQIGLLQPIISHPPVVETQNDLEMAALGGLGAWLNDIGTQSFGIWADPTIPGKVNGSLPMPQDAQAYLIRLLQAQWTSGLGYAVTLFPWIGLPPVLWLELYRLAYYAPQWATSPTGINFVDFNMTRTNAIGVVESVSEIFNVLPQCSVQGSKYFGPSQNIVYGNLTAGFFRALIDLIWLAWQILSGEAWTMLWLGPDQFLVYTSALYTSNDPILLDFQYNVNRMGQVLGCTAALLSEDTGRFTLATTNIIFFWLIDLPLAVISQAAIAVRSNDPTKFDPLDKGANSTLAQLDTQLDQLKFVASFIYSFDNADSNICNGRISAACGFGKAAEYTVEFFTSIVSISAHAFVIAGRATVNLIVTGQLGQLERLNFEILEAAAYGAPSKLLVGFANVIPIDLPCFQGSTADNNNGGICRARPYLQLPNPQNPNICGATFLARLGYWPGILVELFVQVLLFGEQIVYAIENNGVGVDDAFTMIIQNLGAIADTKALGPLCPFGHFGDCWIDAILPGFGKVLSPFVCLINSFLSNVIKALNSFLIGLVKIFFYLVLLVIGGPTNDFFGKLFQILQMALQLFVLTIDKLFQFFLGLLVGVVRSLFEFACTIVGIFSQSAGQSCRDLLNSFLPQSYGGIDPNYNDNFVNGKKRGTQTPRWRENWFTEAYDAFKAKQKDKSEANPYEALRDIFQKGNTQARRAVFYSQATEYATSALNAWVTPLLTFDGLLPKQMLDETKVYVQIPTENGMSERPLILLRALGFIENVTVVNATRMRCDDKRPTVCQPDPEIKVTMRSVDPERLPDHFATHLPWTRGTPCGEFFMHARGTKTADLGHADYAMMVTCVQDTLKSKLPAFVSPYLNFLPTDFFTNDASKIEMLGVVVNLGAVTFQWLDDTNSHPTKVLTPGYIKSWADRGLNVSHYKEWCDALCPIPWNMTHNATLMKSIPEIEWTDWIDHVRQVPIQWYQKRNQGLLFGNFGGRKGRMRLGELDRGATRTDADGQPVEDDGVDLVSGLQMSMLLGWDYAMAAVADQRKGAMQSMEERGRLAGNVDRANNQTVDDPGALLAGSDHPLLVVIQPQGNQTRKPSIREAIYYTKGLESLKNHDHAQVVNNFAVAMDHLFLVATDSLKELGVMTGGLGFGSGNDTTYFDHILKADNYRGEDYVDLPVRKYRKKLEQPMEAHKKRALEEEEDFMTIREVCESGDQAACEAEQLTDLENHRMEKALHRNVKYVPSKAWCASGTCEDGSPFHSPPPVYGKKRAAPKSPEEVQAEQKALFEQHRLEESRRWNETAERLAKGWRSFATDTWTKLKESVWRGYAKAVDRFMIVNGFGTPGEQTEPIRDGKKRSVGSQEDEPLPLGLANRTATARVIIAAVAGVSSYFELNTTYRAHLCHERNANMSETKRKILCDTRNWHHALNAFLDDPDELNEADRADFDLWLRLFNETAEATEKTWKELVEPRGKAKEARAFVSSTWDGLYNVVAGTWDHVAYGIAGERLDKHLATWVQQWNDAKSGLEPRKEETKEKPDPPPRGAYGKFKRPYTHVPLEELRRQQKQWRDEFARMNTNGTYDSDGMLQRMGQMLHKDIQDSWIPGSRLNRFWEEMKSDHPDKTRLVGPDYAPLPEPESEFMDMPMKVYRAAARAMRSGQLESEDRMAYWSMYEKSLLDLRGSTELRETQYSVNRIQIRSPLLRKRLFAENMGVPPESVSDRDVPEKLTLTLFKEAVLVQRPRALPASVHASDVWAGMNGQSGQFGAHDSTLHPYGYYESSDKNTSIGHHLVKRGVVIDAGSVELRYYSSAFATGLKLADMAVRNVLTTNSLAPLRMMTWDRDEAAHASTLPGTGSVHVKRDLSYGKVERGTLVKDLIRIDFEHPKDSRYAQVSMATGAGNAQVAPFRSNMIRTQFFILPTDDQDALNFAHRIIGCASNNTQLCEQCLILDQTFATEAAVFNTWVSYTVNYMGPAVLDTAQTIVYLTTYNATARIGTGTYSPRFPSPGVPVGFWFRAIQQEFGPGFQPPQYGFWQRFFMEAFEINLPTSLIYNGTLNAEYQAYLEQRQLYPNTPINWGWEIIDRLSSILQLNLAALADTVIWFIVQNASSASTFIHNSVVCNYTTNLNCSKQIAGFFTGFLELFWWYVAFVVFVYIISGQSETWTAGAVMIGIPLLIKAHMIVVYGNSVFCGLAPLCYWKEWFDVLVYTVLPKCLPWVGTGVMDTNYNLNNCMACSTGFGALLFNSTTTNPAAQNFINCFQYGYINAADGFTTLRWYWENHNLDTPFILNALEWYSNIVWNYGANLVGAVSPSIADTVIRPQANSRWATQAVQQNWRTSDATYANVAGCSVATIGFGVSTATVGALVAAVTAYSLLNLIWALIPVMLTLAGFLLGYMWAAAQNSFVRLRLLHVQNAIHSHLRFDKLDKTTFAHTARLVAQSRGR